MGDLFNEVVGSDQFKPVLKSELLQITKVASKITGYDSQKLNDTIGKHMSKTLLESQSLEEDLRLLRNVSKLNFKLAYVEKVEQAVVNDLLENTNYVTERPDFLISYMKSYKGRRKISQV